MAITTLAQLKAARRQLVSITSITQAAAVANAEINFVSRFSDTGAPSGTLAGTNTANGIVPTSSSAGYPRIVPFAAGAHGYLVNATITRANEGAVYLFDRLFVAGAYNFNAATSLASQPSFSSRLINTNYNECEIWIEVVTNLQSGVPVPTLSIGYTNQDGTTGRTATYGFTASLNLAATTCRPFALQSGDSGVQRIDSVTCTNFTAGTFNVMVLRRLAQVYVRGILGTGTSGTALREIVQFGTQEVLPQLFQDSALYVLSKPNGNTSSVTFPRVVCTIAEG